MPDLGLRGPAKAAVQVEPTGPQDRRVEGFGVVACSNQNDPFCALKLIDLGEELVDDLSAILRSILVRALPRTGRVDFVNEQDGWLFADGLGKAAAHLAQHVTQVSSALPHAKGTFDNGYACRGRDRAGEHGLPGPGFARKQDRMGQFRPRGNAAPPGRQIRHDVSRCPMRGRVATDLFKRHVGVDIGGRCKEVGERFSCRCRSRRPQCGEEAWDVHLCQISVAGQQRPDHRPVDLSGRGMGLCEERQDDVAVNGGERDRGRQQPSHIRRQRCPSGEQDHHRVRPRQRGDDLFLDAMIGLFRELAACVLEGADELKDTSILAAWCAQLCSPFAGQKEASDRGCRAGKLILVETFDNGDRTAAKVFQEIALAAEGGGKPQGHQDSGGFDVLSGLVATSFVQRPAVDSGRAHRIEITCVMSLTALELAEQFDCGRPPTVGFRRDHLVVGVELEVERVIDFGIAQAPHQHARIGCPWHSVGRCRHVDDSLAQERGRRLTPTAFSENVGISPQWRGRRASAEFRARAMRRKFRT